MVFAIAAGPIVMIFGTVDTSSVCIFLRSHIIIQERLKNINGNSKVATPKAYILLQKCLDYKYEQHQ